MAKGKRVVKQPGNTRKAKSTGRRAPQKASNAKARSKNSAKRKRNPADHLEQYKWQPGQSGNPNGRPPNPLSLTNRLRQHLDEPASKYEHVCRIADKLGVMVHDKTVGDVLMAAATMHAILSDRGAHLSIILDRVDGTTKQAPAKDPAEQAADVQAFLADAEASVGDV